MFATEYESQWRPRHSPSRLLRRPTLCVALATPLPVLPARVPGYPEEVAVAGPD